MTEKPVGSPDPAVAIDATALHHFAKAGHLGSLQRIVGLHGRPVTTQVVLDEVAGASGVVRSAVSTARWIEVAALNSLDDIRALARFTNRMGAGDRDLGEATVLAWALRNQALALIDDRKARGVGASEGVTVHGSLWFLRQAEMAGEHSPPETRLIIDDLVASGMYLPCTSTTYASWCTENASMFASAGDALKEVGEDPGA